MTKTEREAVNEILLALNEAPLPDDESSDSIQIAITSQKFLSISKDSVLKKGWNFNTFTLELSPTDDGYIVIPNSFISVDPIDSLSDIVVVDYRLYDKENKTYRFDGSVECEVIMDINFDDIPFVYRDYIVKRAKVSAYISIIGSSQELSLYREELAEATIDALRDNANSIDGDVLQNVTARE